MCKYNYKYVCIKSTEQRVFNIFYFYRLIMINSSRRHGRTRRRCARYELDNTVRVRRSTQREDSVVERTDGQTGGAVVAVDERALLYGVRSSDAENLSPKRVSGDKRSKNNRSLYCILHYSFFPLIVPMLPTNHAGQTSLEIGRFPHFSPIDRWCQ